MEERRRLLRRQTDRDLLRRLAIQQAEIERLQNLLASQSHDVKRERRHRIREACKLAIHMEIGHASGHSTDWSTDSVEVKGKLYDLSAGGASIYTKQPFETGQRLRLDIIIPSGARIASLANVRWVKAIPEKGVYMSGVKFLDMTPRDGQNLTRFLAELEDEEQTG